LLPFPIIMFSLSRWSGGLVARIGHRIPLTVGPLVAAIGLGLLALPRDGGSFWTTFFPGLVVLGFGMAVTVAPLTTTVMDAAESQHSGVASGVNNAVARIAGLIAIAVFGVIVARTFDSHVEPRLDRLTLSREARAAVQRELPKMAGAQLAAIPSLAPAQRAAAREAIDMSFSDAFRVALRGAAALALGAAIVGAMIL
jgi:MFS family permease